MGEVEVAVDMVAPPEHGRYVGYWRLTGPMGHRKFGQRVWCHIQVVDANAPVVAPSDIDIKRAASTPRGLATDGDDEASASMDASSGAKPMDMEPVVAEPPTEPPISSKMPPISDVESPAAVEGSVADLAKIIAAAPGGAVGQETENAAEKIDAKTTEVMDAQMITIAASEAAKDGSLEESLSDEGELVGSTAAEAGVEAELAAMGFVDAELVRAVLSMSVPTWRAASMSSPPSPTTKRSWKTSQTWASTTVRGTRSCLCATTAA